MTCYTCARESGVRLSENRYRDEQHFVWFRYENVLDRFVRYNRDRDEIIVDAKYGSVATPSLFSSSLVPVEQLSVQAVAFLADYSYKLIEYPCVKSVIEDSDYDIDVDAVDMTVMEQVDVRCPICLEKSVTEVQDGKYHPTWFIHRNEIEDEKEAIGCRGWSNLLEEWRQRPNTYVAENYEGTNVESRVHIERQRNGWFEK